LKSTINGEKLDSTQAVYQALKKAGIDFVVSMPCVNLKKLLEMVECDPNIKHVPVTREEEGFGIAAGAYMGGKKPAILMQNSGLGNSVNVLASLYKLYQFPILMVMSHRGTEGEFMSAQIPMGQATPLVLDALEIAYLNPKNPEEALKVIPEGWILAETAGAPLGILLDITFW
jgi:sulfopyruvate decarboxylase subunit alpha